MCLVLYPTSSYSIPWWCIAHDALETSPFTPNSGLVRRISLDPFHFLPPPTLNTFQPELLCIIPQRLAMIGALAVYIDRFEVAVSCSMHVTQAPASTAEEECYCLSYALRNAPLRFFFLSGVYIKTPPLAEKAA